MGLQDSVAALGKLEIGGMELIFECLDFISPGGICGSANIGGGGTHVLRVLGASIQLGYSPCPNPKPHSPT